ncbi:MAG: shikimate dehydrogenase [Elusimicrobiota bacterium]
MKIDSSLKITGLFGWPVRHTLSPAMHNAGFRALKLGFVYLPFEVNPDKLEAAADAVRILGLRGVNITIPHKENIARFIDRIDPLAKRIGSVNTVVNNNGTLTGYNTDGAGFLKDLAGHGFKPKGRTAVLFGAGGAGKAVAAVLSWAKAKKIFITDIDRRRAETLAKRFSNAEFVPIGGWKEKLKSADLLVNATPAGMRKGKPPATSKELGKKIFVYDVVYNRKTELLVEAGKAGAKHCGGLGMLLNQGAIAFELWTGKSAPVHVMRKALLKALSNKN